MLFSDGKYNITNDFGGTLYEYIGKEKAIKLMHYVDDINMAFGGEGTKLYSHSRYEIQEAVSAEWLKSAGCFCEASGEQISITLY